MKKKYNEARKRRRERLWEEQKGRCFYCKRPMLHWSTYSGKGPQPEMLCTIEHLYDRYDSRRWHNVIAFQHVVLACYACNHSRGKERQREMNALGVLSFCDRRRKYQHGVA